MPLGHFYVRLTRRRRYGVSEAVACRLAQDVATEKILAALAATRDGPGNPPATP
jgi:hypothetical protein